MNREVLRLFKAGITGKNLPYIGDSKLKEIIEIIKEQSLLPYLYNVYLEDKFKKFDIQYSIIFDKFLALKDEITRLFTESNIPFYFIKGMEIYSLYPKASLRTLGDIDLIVTSKDYKKAKEILTNNGFTIFNIAKHHAEFKKNGLIVELHHTLLSKDDVGNSSFKNPFNIIDESSSVQKHMIQTYHLYYILLHYYKHLLRGAGIRPLGDIYLLLLKGKIDYDLLAYLIQEDDLQEFLNTILSCLEEIFDFNSQALANKINIIYKKNPDIDQFIEYLLNSGIHGNGKNNSPTENEFKNSKDNKFVFLLKKIFLPFSLMKEKYPYSKTIILLPFAYIHHFFSLIFNKRKKLETVLESKKDNSFLKKFGLNK